jgi:hypothetical protein
LFGQIVLDSSWIARSIEYLGHGKRFGNWVELGLILVTHLEIYCKDSYLIIVERRDVLSIPIVGFNIELDKQIYRVLFLSVVYFFGLLHHRLYLVHWLLVTLTSHISLFIVWVYCRIQNNSCFLHMYCWNPSQVCTANVNYNHERELCENAFICGAWRIRCQNIFIICFLRCEMYSLLKCESNILKILQDTWKIQRAKIILKFYISNSLSTS